MPIVCVEVGQTAIVYVEVGQKAAYCLCGSRPESCLLFVWK